ncbi:subtilisin-like protease SBT4.4 isoform X1 [Spinacia oleracea]|uniref:Subtilisin-like protease SBT4.4 isoform X1 n=2 Tax=Spinacia oleracea TaxID=3562 RepID=A0A9R0JX74_SPIOL|nr:subtilisin-like protease SBT4.4 isoform X1 [Spinacia oleracea]
MGSTTEDYFLTSEYHIGILQQVLEDSMAKESLVRSYTKSFNGFAARLTEKESEILKGMKEVVSVFPSKALELQTTRSWDFMGFTETVAPRETRAESNLILGVIDSGIWPESPSFNDNGFSAPPKKWKGACKGGENFTCNNKLIGARTFFDSARDDIGHGTHTASTAAGRIVDDANFYGLAEGSARGAVPSARIAAYKVCDTSDCDEADILSAFDEAIADGVDLITISIGNTDAADIYSDTIAIGAFHALQNGILTVQSAGNSGNVSGSVTSVAPWLFSVAASFMDRRILDKVVLGNRRTLIGNSINSFTLNGDMFPLVYGKQASTHCSEDLAVSCSAGCLDKNLVKGKIVVCDSTDGVIGEGLRAGALGVLARAYVDDVSQIQPIPAVLLKPHEFEVLLSYLNSTKAPMANILKSESFNDTSAPVVVSFSSRGPNPIAPDILKPDITAPGVEILAAFSPNVSVSEYPNDKRSVKYAVISGTSMSCPHVAGAAVYVKSIHPDWSPSAIKSALMTTARPMSSSKNPDAEFAYGSGHLNPVEAVNPGLVYETTEDDYLTFLCKLGYSKEQISLISGNKSFSCPKKSLSDPNDVNYPSMSASVNAEKSFNIKFRRTVTNVGVANSTYTAKVESGEKMKVTVNPKTLSFTSLKEQKYFDVSVVGKGLASRSQVSASLVWSDGSHFVRSPVVVYSM